VVEGDADTLKHVPDVYALGDCCSPVETPLPALAQVNLQARAHTSMFCRHWSRHSRHVAPQVAEQQGKYLAKCLNDEARGHDGPHKPFVYHHLGSMASLGAHCKPDDDCAPSHCMLVASQRAHVLGECACWQAAVQRSLSWASRLPDTLTSRGSRPGWHGAQRT